MGRPLAGSPSVALLGLGEAGAALAADLAEAGVDVRGWDPASPPSVAGVRLAASAPAAVAGATVVLSVNSAKAAVPAAKAAVPPIEPGAVYADLNTASPAVKREVATVVEQTGGAFADVALLAPVPDRGLATPSLASGPGAAAFACLMAPLGMPVEALGEEPGEAARGRLLRSVFVKGMAAAALESLAAARAAGCEEWLREQIAGTLAGADEALLERWVQSSPRHAARRVVEMEAAGDMLGELGVPARVAEAARGWLEQLDNENGGRQDC